MVDPALFLAFLPAAAVLLATPGPDMLFCLGQGLHGGPRAALAADAGVATGVLVHALAGGLGLSALVAAWPAAFEAIRWVGVAYLLWVAWRALREPLGGAGDGAPRRAARAFRDGLMTNLSNPKVLLFMLALLPQFVRPEAGPVLSQFLALGAVLAAGALVVNGAVGLMAGGIGGALARSPRLERAMRAVTATLFAGLALRLAFERR
jgi:threonine/homoserine/homoserine lactone efflux protein